MLARASGEQTEAREASITILQEALDGLKLYHKSHFSSYERKMIKISMHKGTNLLGTQEWCRRDKNCIVLVPSLINTWRIFDIEENHSFAAYLAGKNLQPIIVDWALPHVGNTPDMDDYIVDHLAPLLRQLRDDGYHIRGIAGYCMGATMLSALASACPDIYEDIGKTVLIAGPWGFDYQSPEQYVRLQAVGTQAVNIANAANGIVPVDFVQSLFWAIDPLQFLRKFRKFRSLDQKSAQARRFVRVEDWLNDGRKVTGKVASLCLYDWYKNDLPAKGRWIVDHAVVDPAFIPGDVMVVWGMRDNLVPMVSVKKILDYLPHAKTMALDTGHIGLMASDRAPENLWKAVAEFVNSA